MMIWIEGGMASRGEDAMRDDRQHVTSGIAAASECDALG
jgi:hypothetical protein